MGKELTKGEYGKPCGHLTESTGFKEEGESGSKGGQWDGNKEKDGELGARMKRSGNGIGKCQ